jgi:hypothetical protein
MSQWTLSEIMLHISDMDAMPPSLKAQILDRVGRGATSAVWTPADFLDLAGRDAVDKSLQRLVKWGELRRIDRGLYDKPQFNSLTRQDSVPEPRAVIDAVAPGSDPRAGGRHDRRQRSRLHQCRAGEDCRA